MPASKHQSTCHHRPSSPSVSRAVSPRLAAFQGSTRPARVPPPSCTHRCTSRPRNTCEKVRASARGVAEMTRSDALELTSLELIYLELTSTELSQGKEGQEALEWWVGRGGGSMETQGHGHHHPKACCGCA
eukprot:scaffold287_cov337-Pavlova_lutheri.AAC.108